MKKNIVYGFLIFGLVCAFAACSDQINKDKLGAIYEINFNEIELDRFSFKIPEAPFTAGDKKSGVITFNVVRSGSDIDGGFVLSNKNWRSYPWCYSEDYAGPVSTVSQREAALDSCRFSVYTNRGNMTETYVVAKMKDDLAYFTLDKPNVIEHILLANTTWNFLLMSYSSYYTGYLNTKTQWYEALNASGAAAKVANPKMPDTGLTGRWTLPTPDGKPVMHLAGASNLAKNKASRLAAETARLAGKTDLEVYNDSIAARNITGAGWYKITIKGYLNGSPVGKIDYYMGARTNAIADLPQLDKIKDNWFAVELSSLGTVDKIVLNADSYDKDDQGRSRIPPYVCIDGIRLRDRAK